MLFVFSLTELKLTNAGLDLGSNVAVDFPQSLDHNFACQLYSLSPRQNANHGRLCNRRSALFRLLGSRPFRRLLGRFGRPNRLSRRLLGSLDPRLFLPPLDPFREPLCNPPSNSRRRHPEHPRNRGRAKFSLQAPKSPQRESFFLARSLLDRSHSPPTRNALCALS